MNNFNGSLGTKGRTQRSRGEKQEVGEKEGMGERGYNGLIVTWETTQTDTLTNPETTCSACCPFPCCHGYWSSLPSQSHWKHSKAKGK